MRTRAWRVEEVAAVVIGSAWFVARRRVDPTPLGQIGASVGRIK